LRRISRKINEMPLSPHRVLVSIAEKLRREGKTTFNFSAGQPGLPPAKQVLEQLANELLKNSFKYSRYIETRGLYELREAISEDLKQNEGVDVPPDNILITTGASEALYLVLSTITEPGDEILLLDPCYSVYWNLVRYLGLKIKTCPQTIDNGFQPSEECIKNAITEKTAAILFASPDNPTSRIIDKDIANLIMEEAYSKKVWVVYDEAYKNIIYEGSHVQLNKHPLSQEVLISVNSFSKDLAMPGFRIGYVYGPKEVIDNAVKIKGFTSICTPNISQRLALLYLKSNIRKEYLSYALNVYRKRRDAMYDALIKYLPEARIVKPRASMYFFPDLSNYLERIGMDDIEFSFKLAEEKHVVVLPGSIFGPQGRRHLRITFVSEPEEKIVEGIKRISEFTETLEKRQT